MSIHRPGGLDDEGLKPERLGFDEEIARLMAELDSDTPETPVTTVTHSDAVEVSFEPEPSTGEMPLTQWTVTSFRPVITRGFEIAEISQALELTEVVTVYTDPRQHHVEVSFSGTSFHVKITPLAHDEMSDADRELMTALESAWYEMPN